MPAFEDILAALRTMRAPLSLNEYSMHKLVESVLSNGGFPWLHEAPLAPKSRIDYLSGRIGIEIKRGKPQLKPLLKQISRYLESDRLDSLIVISERQLELPPLILGKRCENLCLIKLWGNALPSSAKKNTDQAILPPEQSREAEAVSLPPLGDLPTYLKPIDGGQRVYGVLSYQARGKFWVIKGEANVTELAKRLFPGADHGKRGQARFSAHARIIGDLNWLMQRYPLAIAQKDLDRWQAALLEAQTRYRRLEAFRSAPPELSPLDSCFNGTLRPFQAYGVSWLCHVSRGLLADEMGLGKTVQALAALACQRAFPVIIIVPPHLVTNWANELKRFLTLDGQSPSVHIIRGKKPSPLPAAQIYLIHYLLLGSWKDTLCENSYNAIIFDEIQELRHAGTDKYSAASLISDRAQKVYGLSGTPIYNLGGEIWNIINILDFHFLGDWESFSREWCSGYNKRLIQNPQMLGEFLRREGLMLRRTKSEVLPDLPDKRRLVQEIDSDDPLYRRLMEPVVKKLLSLRNTPSLSPQERALLEGAISQDERQANGLAKAPFVAQFVKALLESGEKVLLFAHHHRVMDAYSKSLKNHSPVFITGRESQAQKDSAVTRFMDGGTNLCCISLRSASGLNLQRASCVVFGELDWSPAVHSQAEDRAHRIGQKDSLLCYYLVSPSGSDSLIQEALGLKVSQFLGLMGEQAQSPVLEAASGLMARHHVESLLKQLEQNHPMFGQTYSDDV